MKRLRYLFGCVVVLAVLGGLVSLASPKSNVVDVAFTKVVEHAAFTPRDAARALLHRDQLWLSNGYYHGRIAYRDLWKSSDGRTWRLVSEKTPYEPFSAVVSYRGEIWAIRSSVWRSQLGEKWHCEAEETPFAGTRPGSAVVFKDRIWYLGVDSCVWSTQDGRQWNCETANAPYGDRGALGVVVFDGRIWVMGGMTPATDTPPEGGYADRITNNDVWASADGVNWTRVSEHAPWRPRQWFAACAYNGRIWIVGGHDNVTNRNLGDAWCSSDGRRWRQVRIDRAFSARHAPACCAFDGSLWLLAGNSWPVQNDIWRLTEHDSGEQEGCLAGRVAVQGESGAAE